MAIKKKSNATNSGGGKKMYINQLVKYLIIIAFGLCLYIPGFYAQEFCKSDGLPLEFPDGRILNVLVDDYKGHKILVRNSESTENDLRHNSPIVIDMLFIYTQYAKLQRGNNSNIIHDEILEMVQHINTIYEASDINVLLNVKWIGETNYIESFKIDNDLIAISEYGDGKMDEVQGLRNCFGADLVVLITGNRPQIQTDNNNKGITWIWTNDISFDLFKEYGSYSVIRLADGPSKQHNILNTARTIAHEIGHNFGCHHQVSKLTQDSLNKLRYSYGVGYEFTGYDKTYRTIMGIGASSRIDFISNPHINYFGVNIGNKDANCALVMNRTSKLISSFREYYQSDLCPLDVVGCDHVPLSGLKMDICGICNGDGLSCLDCEGTPFGSSKIDCNGTCGGQLKIDCNGICGGKAELDKCGICEGHNDCIDCNGIVFGTATYDCSGKCGGEMVIDCESICGGLSRLDCDGTCNGNKTLDCMGTCGGKAVYDCRGVCNGVLKYDCKGKCGGPAKIDCDGTCDGPNHGDCLGVCGGKLIYDCRGICGGLAKLDCGGICEGILTVDLCGTCGGNNDCTDCAGVPFGKTIKDCANVCNGTATYDCNGVCMGNDKLDCDGICGGSSFINECGFCISSLTDITTSSNTGLWKDCNGVCGGTAVIDNCGVCSDGNTNHVFDSDKDLCGECFGNSSKCKCECFLPASYYYTHNCYSVIPQKKVAWPEPYHLCNETLCNGNYRWVDILSSDSTDMWILLTQQWITLKLNLNLYICHDEPTDVLNENSTLTIVNGLDIMGYEFITSTCNRDWESLDESESLYGTSLFLAITEFNERKLATSSDCVTNDTVTYSSDFCKGGCTRYPIYWQLHNRNATIPTLRIPWPSINGEISELNVLCGAVTWLDVMTPSRIDVSQWSDLAYLWVAAKLNVINGACLTYDIQTALDVTENILKDTCVNNNPIREQISGHTEIKSILNFYVNGIIGPGECNAKSLLEEEVINLLETNEDCVCKIKDHITDDNYNSTCCVRDSMFWMIHHNDPTLPGVRYKWPFSPFDLNSDGILNDPGTDTPLCFIKWIQILRTTDYGSEFLWYELAQNYIAAQLNILSGVCAPDRIVGILHESVKFLEISCGITPSNNLVKDAMKDALYVLFKYNNGEYGPKKCINQERDTLKFLLSGLDREPPIGDETDSNSQDFTVAFDTLSSESTSELVGGDDGDGESCNTSKETGFLAWAVVVTVVLFLVVMTFLVWLFVRRNRGRLNIGRMLSSDARMGSQNRDSIKKKWVNYNI